jgi:hypothetical protein
MDLEALKKEYAEQDNRSTAFPIYVQVQEKHCIGVLASGYGARCPFGDGEEVTEYRHSDFEGTYREYDELIKEMEDYYSSSKEFEAEQENIEEVNMGYIWVPVEFFLTIKGAEEYMKANAHNHGELRTYVSHFERRNFEMRELLETLGFKTNDYESTARTGD